MDEVEIIQSHLLSQAGEGTDVILGLGYDNTLGDKLGITLIATGFEYRDPFTQKEKKQPLPQQEEKIVMVLGDTPRPTPPAAPAATPVASVNKPAETVPQALAPRLVEELPVAEAPMPDAHEYVEQPYQRDQEPLLLFELNMPGDAAIIGMPGNNKETTTPKAAPKAEEEKTQPLMPFLNEPEPVVEKPVQQQSTSPFVSRPAPAPAAGAQNSNTQQPAAAGGYLARPSNIYAESKTEVIPSKPTAEEPVPSPIVAAKADEDISDLQMQLVERDDIPAADMPLAHQAQLTSGNKAEDPALLDEAEEQKRRAAERLHKLRNLSFNVNGADPNNEFETVPAYIRRNMELHSNPNHVEQFYSNYEVRKDDKNQTQISTINTFLDGKKPD
jgi:cell division protein FtsZ